MFRIKSEDPTFLQNIFTAVSTILDEVQVNIAPDGLTTRGMDPSRVVMIDLELPKASFTEYNVKEAMKLCFSAGEFIKLLKRARKEEAVELSWEDPKVAISFIKEQDVSKYLMPTLEPTSEEMPVPKVVFHAKIKFTSEGFKRKLDDGNVASDHMRFEADPEKIKMEAMGDLTQWMGEVKKGAKDLLEIEAKEPAKATFSLSYLVELLKDVDKICDIIYVEFSTDMPMKIDCQLPQEGRLTYYLAPRIEIE